MAFDGLKAEEGGEKSTAYSNEDKQSRYPDPIEVEKNRSLQVKQGKKPDWTDKESELYPASMYLTGVGYGPDRQSAEDNARSEIAKIFYSDIHSRTSTFQEYSTQSFFVETTKSSHMAFTSRWNSSKACFSNCL